MFDMYLDLPNLLLILCVVLLAWICKLIPQWLACCLGVFAFVPYFINDFLIPVSYMPDQYRYIDVVREIRSLNFDLEEQGTVRWAGWMLAAFPLPFVETVKSLGFFNRLAASILLIWLYASKNIRGLPLIFLLFYPSYILYSSMALRDTLILVLMIVSVFMYIDRRIFFFVLSASLLLLIKFQNFFLIVIFVFLHEMFRSGSMIYKYKNYLVLFLVLIAIALQNEVLPILDGYRQAMYKENGGDIVDFESIVSLYDFSIMAIPGAFYFLLKPLPWEAENALQMIQFVENMVVLFFLIVSFRFTWRVDRKVFLKWFLFLMAALMIYESVVFNFGTAARYKFPFMVLVIVGLYYEIGQKKVVRLRSTNEAIL